MPSVMSITQCVMDEGLTTLKYQVKFHYKKTGRGEYDSISFDIDILPQTVGLLNILGKF